MVSLFGNFNWNIGRSCQTVFVGYRKCEARCSCIAVRFSSYRRNRSVNWNIQIIRSCFESQISKFSFIIRNKVCKVNRDILALFECEFRSSTDYRSRRCCHLNLDCLRNVSDRNCQVRFASRNCLYNTVRECCNVIIFNCPFQQFCSQCNWSYLVRNNNRIAEFQLNFVRNGNISNCCLCSSYIYNCCCLQTTIWVCNDCWSTFAQSLDITFGVNTDYIIGLFFECNFIVWGLSWDYRSGNLSFFVKSQCNNVRHWNFFSLNQLIDNNVEFCLNIRIFNTCNRCLCSTLCYRPNCQTSNIGNFSIFYFNCVSHVRSIAWFECQRYVTLFTFVQCHSFWLYNNWLKRNNFFFNCYYLRSTVGTTRVGFNNFTSYRIGTNFLEFRREFSSVNIFVITKRPNNWVVIAHLVACTKRYRLANNEWFCLGSNEDFWFNRITYSIGYRQRIAYTTHCVFSSYLVSIVTRSWNLRQEFCALSNNSTCNIGPFNYVFGICCRNEWNCRSTLTRWLVSYIQLRFCHVNYFNRIWYFFTFAIVCQFSHTNLRYVVNCLTCLCSTYNRCGTQFVARSVVPFQFSKVWRRINHSF